MLILSINLLFIFFKKKNNYLYIFLILFLHIVTQYSFKSSFTNWLFTYESLVLVPILISLYFSTRDVDENVFEKLIFSIWIFSLFLNYDYFFWVSIFFFLLKILKEDYQFETTKNYFKVYFTFFYFLRIISSIIQDLDIWRRLSSNIYESPYFFNDLKILFEYFDCNFYFNSVYCAEKVNLGYGPLTLLISFKNNPEVVSMLFAILLIVTFLFFGNKAIELSKYPGIIMMILVSPPINFVIERLNMDFIIMLTCLLIFKNYEKNYIPKSLIIFCFVLLKLYMVSVLFVLIFIGLKKEKIKVSLVNFILFLMSIIYLFSVLTSSETMLNKIPNPFGYSWSFGLVSLSKNLLMLLGNTNQMYFYILLFLLVLLIILFLYKRNFNLKIDKNDEYMTYSIISIFVLTGLYANFDYRLALLLPLFLLNKDVIKNKFFDNILILFILSSSSPYVKNFSLNPFYNLKDFFASSIILVNTILFIMLLSMGSLVLIRLLFSATPKGLDKNNTEFIS